MWLEAGEGERALLALKEAEAAVGEEDPEDAATRHYLLARAHLLLGNPGLALEEIRKALALEEESGHKAYGTPLVEGQALLQLGRYEEAMASFREALARADAGERPHVLHEMGVAALDHGAYPEAEEHLRALVREEGYPYLAQAYADLAEALYRQGRYQEAEAAAREAVARGRWPRGSWSWATWPTTSSTWRRPWNTTARRRKAPRRGAGSGWGPRRWWWTPWPSSATAFPRRWCAGARRCCPTSTRRTSGTPPSPPTWSAPRPSCGRGSA